MENLSLAKHYGGQVLPMLIVQVALNEDKWLWDWVALHTAHGAGFEV